MSNNPFERAMQKYDAEKAEVNNVSKERLFEYNNIEIPNINYRKEVGDHIIRNPSNKNYDRVGKNVSIYLSDEALAILEEYCRLTVRSKSKIIDTLIIKALK